MTTLPSKLFINCVLSADKDAGFYDTIPAGFDHEISLYLSKETMQDDNAIQKAADFFDRAPEWDAFCRKAFLSTDEGSEDRDMVEEYFCFYQEEAPDVFNAANPSKLTLPDMVNLLVLRHMASHERGADQCFTVDFTLGYDQLLSVYFNSDFTLDHLAWES